MIRTATQYLDSIRDSSEAYVDGERVREHPGARAAASDASDASDASEAAA